MQQTGAKINIPPPSLNKPEVVVSGEKEGVRYCVQQIMRIYKEKVKYNLHHPTPYKPADHEDIQGKGKAGPDHPTPYKPANHEDIQGKVKFQ